MKVFFVLIWLVIAIQFTVATIYFYEDFTEGWETRWTQSRYKKGEGDGKFEITPGKHYSDPIEDRGLKTTQWGKFYIVSSKFRSVLNNKDKTMVVQYRVKHEQNLDCGGGYVKILPPGSDMINFNGDTTYNIMFGPDICIKNKKVQLILNYKGKNHPLKKNVTAESDEYSHLYTLILRPDNSYEIRIDNKKKASGRLEEDWDMLPPKKIKNPRRVKPSKWIDDKDVPDPTDQKPEKWDEIPREVPDLSVQKPVDWDDSVDGKWVTPMKRNPEYKGEWKQRTVPNPKYKGEWNAPEIDNPKYKYDSNLYAFNNGIFGIEVWQVKAGSIFDDILVTDSVPEAEAYAEDILWRMEGEREHREELIGKEDEIEYIEDEKEDL